MKPKRNQQRAKAQQVASPTHIKDLTPDPVNRRSHNPRNIGMVVDALHEVGAARSIVIDEHGVVLAGNGVLEAAGEAGITRLRVIDADGQEIIAVRRSGLTEAQKRHLAIADNRTAELASWNSAQFKADLGAGLEFSKFFTKAELDAVVGPEDAKAGLTDPDEVPAERPTSIVAGDLFELGAHRLLCGDSTSAGDVGRLLGDVKPFLMVTDPPYGVDYDPDWRNRSLRADGTAIGGRRTGQVANDDQADWTPAWRLFTGPVAYVWHAYRTAYEVWASLLAADFEIRAELVWRKPRFAISRGHYHPQHESCFYAFRDGTSAKFTEDRSQTTVWDIDLKDATGETNHGTQKPVECMARPIRNHGGPEDHVYEPFSGSGTTIIAAEQLGRRCFAMEITPAYVQMAIDRFEAFTGQKAQKVGEAVHA